MDENSMFSQYETPFKDLVDYAERLELTEDRYEKSGGNRNGASNSRGGQAGKARVVTQVTAGPNRVLLREVLPLIFQRIVIVFSTVLDVDTTAIRARC